MSCPASSTLNTITVINNYIETTLDKLILDIETCGTFIGLKAFVGSGFLTNTYIDLGARIVSDQVVGTNSSSVHLELLPEDLGLGTGADIDTIIIFEILNSRLSTDIGLINETKMTGVASYASVYPCLINKIDNIDAGCNDCSSLNNALLLDMLMQSTSTYLMYGRYSDAVNTYNKMKIICREYDLIFSTDPTFCDTYGGIGCWILQSTFSVTPGPLSPGSLLPPTLITPIL